MLALLGTALIVGLGVGFSAGGRLEHLRDVQLRWTPMLFGSLLLGLLPLFVSMSRGPRLALQIASLLGVMVFLAFSTAAARGAVRWGFGAVIVGWAMNFLAIAANGGMPLSLWAWERSGQVGDPTPGEGGFFKIVIAGPDSPLRFLGDAIPIRGISQVVSIGDLFLMLGIAWIIAAGMRGGRHAKRRTQGAA